jgi:hypothetical protein
VTHKVFYGEVRLEARLFCIAAPISGGILYSLIAGSGQCVDLVGCTVAR